MTIASNYLINETSQDFNVNLEVNSKPESLNNILNNIKQVSNGNIDVQTIGSSGHSKMHVLGDLKKPTANGHLILNPKGVDLRIIPGKMKNVIYEKIESEQYKANFLDDKGNKVLSMSFQSNEEIDIGKKEVISKKLSGRYNEKNKNVDTKALINDWNTSRDPHHFHSVLEKHNLEKIDAFRLVPNHLACQVDVNSVMTLLNTVHKDKQPLIVFIDNGSVVQIYTGLIAEIAVDNDKKIHIQGVTAEGNKADIEISENEVGEAWVVNKNTPEGFITSLELFNKKEEHIAQFYSVRKEGEKQNEYWTNLMKNLPTHEENSHFLIKAANYAYNFLTK